MTSESDFCLLCFDCCYFNRFLQCTIVPVCLLVIIFFLLVTSMDASPNAQEDVDSPYVSAVLR